MRLPPAIIAALAGLGLANLVAADLSTSANTSVTWEDNITRCPDPAAVKNGTRYELAGNVDWHTQVSRDGFVHLSTDALLQACPQFTGLDHTTVGLHLAARRKLGLGPFADVFKADVSYRGSWYRETSLNGTRLEASLAWSKRWNDTWQTVITGEFLHNDGHSPAYDYQNHGLTMEAHYDLSAQWQISAGLRRQWGDQVTYAWLGGSGANFPYVFEIWKNTTVSPVFGKNWYAYTMDAHADTGWVSVAYTVEGDSSLTLRYEEASVVGMGESYRNAQTSLSFVHRF